MIPNIDPTPWLEVGLAGLFAIFALILIGLFFWFMERRDKLYQGELAKRDASWQEVFKLEREERKASRKQSAEIMAEAYGQVRGLAESIQSLDRSIAELQKASDTNGQKQDKLASAISRLEIAIHQRG